MVPIIFIIVDYQTKWISSQSAAVAVSSGTRYARREYESASSLDVNCCSLFSLSLAARLLAFLHSSSFSPSLPPSFLFKGVSRELRNFALLTASFYFLIKIRVRHGWMDRRNQSFVSQREREEKSEEEQALQYGTNYLFIVLH